MNTVKLNAWLLGLFLLLDSTAWTATDEKETVAPVFPKAIEAAQMDKGFRLKERARQALAIQFTPVQAHEVSVGAGGVVRFQDYIAVYRKRDGWIRMVEVEASPNSDGGLRFSSKDFQPGDEVANQGASALRIIDLDLWGPKADACGD